MAEPEAFKKNLKKSYRGYKKYWGKLTEGWVGYVVYAVLGIFIAFLLNQALAFALSTDLPVVAVVSSSMQHDISTEANHYQWLEKNMDYNRSYVNSWPVKDGFLVGDLPIVQGSASIIGFFVSPSVNGKPDYRVGDVIVYSVPNQNVPIIHRIIKINSDGSYMTKGDHNPQLLPFEYAVKPEQIHGRVIFIIPKLGYFKVIVTRLIGGF
jgi:hypothetical protein